MPAGLVFPQLNFINYKCVCVGGGLTDFSVYHMVCIVLLLFKLSRTLEKQVVFALVDSDTG